MWPVNQMNAMMAQHFIASLSNACKRYCVHKVLLACLAVLCPLVLGQGARAQGVCNNNVPAPPAFSFATDEASFNTAMTQANSTSGSTICVKNSFPIQAPAVGSTSIVNVDLGGFNLSGSGALTVAAGGRFVFASSSATAGTTTYSGTTQISGGTLYANFANILSPNSTFNVVGTGVLNLGDVNQTIGGLSGSGTVTQGSRTIGTDGIVSFRPTANSVLTVGSNNQSTDFSGTITDNGNLTPSFTLSLVKTGTGTLTLSGANTYGGTTTISAGTLQLGDGTGMGLLLGSTAIIDNGNFAFDQPAASITAFSQPISGTGTVTQNGPGAVVLFGANSYSGATIVNGGVLATGAIGAFSPNSVFVVNSGGTLDVGGIAQTIAALNGGGTVTNCGPVTSSNEGGCGAASLTLGANGANSTFTGTITDGSAPISIIQAGSGTLTLTGNNSYSGKTWLEAGTLAVGSANALGTSTLDMSPGTTLQFLGSGYALKNNIAFVGSAFADPTIDSGPGTITLAGILSGAGTLGKIGSGTLILTGVNTYTGNTNVDQGILQIDGSIAASPLTTIASGAGLSGTGTTGSVLAQSGGFIAPGNATNPFGILTVNGAASLAPGSALRSNVNPNGASQLAVNGAANINGATLQVTAVNGTYNPATEYTLMTANRGITGTFGTTSVTPLPGLAPVVTYDPNDVFLRFAQVVTQQQGQDSVNQLAGNRQGQMVTNRILSMVLDGFNEQINCSDCISAFGAVGSFAGGIHGRKMLTNDLSIIGGAAFASYESGGVRVTSAPLLAAALRYDLTEWGSSRPFGEIGIFAAPNSDVSYKRDYQSFFGPMQGRTHANTSDYSVFGKLGWVWRVTPIDEASVSGEVAHMWQPVSHAAEAFVPDVNNAPALLNSGTDRMDIVKIGGQWTHLFASVVETQVNIGAVRSFNSHSGLSADILNIGTFDGHIKEHTWAEYGLRIGYRIRKGVIIDAFADGTLGPQPIGNTIHAGLAVRYTW